MNKYNQTYEYVVVPYAVMTEVNPRTGDISRQWLEPRHSEEKIFSNFERASDYIARLMREDEMNGVYFLWRYMIYKREKSKLIES